MSEPKRKPAEVFDPREFCYEEMDERGLDFWKIPVGIRRWLTNDEPLTPLVAQSLNALFGTTTEFWLNLDESYTKHGGGSGRDG